MVPLVRFYCTCLDGSQGIAFSAKIARVDPCYRSAGRKDIGTLVMPPESKPRAADLVKLLNILSADRIEPGNLQIGS